MGGVAHEPPRFFFAPSMGALLRVQVPSQVDHDERSEAQLHEGDRVWEGSVEHKLRADEQESDMRHCQAGRLGKKPRSSCDQSDVVYIRRLCGEGVRPLPGEISPYA